MHSSNELGALRIGAKVPGRQVAAILAELHSNGYNGLGGDTGAKGGG